MSRSGSLDPGGAEPRRATDIGDTIQGWSATSGMVVLLLHRYSSTANKPGRIGVTLVLGSNRACEAAMPSSSRNCRSLGLGFRTQGRGMSSDRHQGN